MKLPPRLEQRKRLTGLACLGLIAGLVVPASKAEAPAPLTTLEYKIIGTRLEVSPAVLSVPKGIAGSVRVDLTGASSLDLTAVLTLKPPFAARLSPPAV